MMRELHFVLFHSVLRTVAIAAAASSISFLPSLLCSPLQSLSCDPPLFPIDCISPSPDPILFFATVTATVSSNC